MTSENHYPQGAADLLRARAELTPDRVALLDVHTGVEYTYRQLNDRANRLANWLRGLGVGPGDRVSILAQNSVHTVDLLYGLGKIGAILAPLNWRLTARELAWIAADCAPKVLICGPEHTSLLAELRREVAFPVVVGIEGAAIEGALAYEACVAAAPVAEPPPPPPAGEDICCILYTSGTTGRPKGAMISHRQVLWNCINTVISWELTADDISPVMTPMFHAGGLFIFLTPLFYVGGKILLARSFDSEASLALIQRERATVVLGVPTLFQMWLGSPSFTAADFSAVRYFVSGGAPCPMSLIAAWRAAKGGYLRQGYGLTEVGVNCFTMTNEESVAKVGSVGKPVFHSRMRIVDEDGRDVARGETGELIIYGPHVCSGYWRNPEATARALRDGWFHTGDMARQDADGFYYMAGRYKDMIISGGENVYAAEVETVFLEHPAVREAALIGHPDEKWGEVGVMIVVARPETATTAGELLAFCRDRLARYKVPKQVIFAESLPYSPYGKVIKAELREKYARSDE
ncbi:MAG TPA: long-chain fatty acid--CoA ligase [Promineifilum sp.]|nr:long-chain fatty acid--CoA ligase [Promineifilum sp.]HRO89640.1 long-chain fatty acid--CoA ligase [Promineifilum sp.]HRQ13374.1 long-chain fatty acid--CoA ligase [Promineifilum sp.]